MHTPSRKIMLEEIKAAVDRLRNYSNTGSMENAYEFYKAQIRNLRGINSSEMEAKKPDQYNAFYKHLIYYLLVECHQFSLSDIGKKDGHKHDVVLYGVRRFRDLLDAGSFADVTELRMMHVVTSLSPITPVSSIPEYNQICVYGYGNRLVDSIISLCGRMNSVSPDYFKSDSRKGKIPLAKQSACYLMRMFGFDYRDISEALNYSDHTTPVRNVQLVGSMLDKNSQGVRWLRSVVHKADEYEEDYGLLDHSL